jgi:hypothetical protein
LPALKAASMPAVNAARDQDTQQALAPALLWPSTVRSRRGIYAYEQLRALDRRGESIASRGPAVRNVPADHRRATSRIRQRPGPGEPTDGTARDPHRTNLENLGFHPRRSPSSGMRQCQRASTSFRLAQDQMSARALGSLLQSARRGASRRQVEATRACAMEREEPRGPTPRRVLDRRSTSRPPRCLLPRWRAGKRSRRRGLV